MTAAASDPDERYIVIDGRRWRATDPSIPSAFRTELVHELMDARRATGEGLRHDQDVSLERRRVQDAKVALGERGEPWWVAPSAEGRRDRIAATIRSLLRARQPGSSICPSDVARTVGGSSWRPLLPEVREVAAVLVRDGTIVVTQRGDSVDVSVAHGPVRLRRGPAMSTESERPAR